MPVCNQRNTVTLDQHVLVRLYISILVQRLFIDIKFFILTPSIGS